MKVVAVTGTNGKTTTVTLLHQLYRLLDRKAGMLGTVENRIVDRVIPATHTTPDALSLQALLREMADAGCTHVFMEASSHAIVQDRIAGTHFAGAVFTNITHDHLDYHGDFNGYIKAKKQLFDQLPASAFAAVNNDDPHAEDMVADTKAKVVTMAVQSVADERARLTENQITGLVLHLDGQELYSSLVGGFNASNLLAVYVVSKMLGTDKINALTQMSLLKPPAGRFERIPRAMASPRSWTTPTPPTPWTTCSRRSRMCARAERRSSPWWGVAATATPRSARSWRAAPRAAPTASS